MTLLTPAMVFRKWVTDGVPESGAYDPKKGEIVQLLDSLFGVTRGGWVVALTKADLLAVTPTDETDGGVVLDDPDPTLNGYYGRDAAAWVQGRSFPDTLALVTLGGIANAQTGTFSSGVDAGNVLEFIATPGTANTGPMTLSHDGETPKPVLNYAGNAMSAGEWATFVRYRDDGLGNYRLTIDANAASVASAAATAASISEAAAAASAALSGPTGVYAATFTGDGVETTFGLPVEPTSAAHVWVTIDGVMQGPDTYTVDALNLIFSEAPPESLDDTFSPVANISYRIVSIASGESVPPDGSVTATKLASSAVTTAKLGTAAVTKSKVASSAIGDTEIDGTEAPAIRTKLGIDTLVGTIVRQVFTSSATYTPSAGMITADILCIGGGGAGGSTGIASSGQQAAAGGGGGGASALKRVTAAEVGASKAVTIGAGGTPGAVGNNAGGNGAATSVGALCVANGGTGGLANNANAGSLGGAGGTGGTGDLIVPGQAGGDSAGGGIITLQTFSGEGGDPGSTYGHGARPIRSTSSNGRAGTGYGAGGGGAMDYNGSAARAGGAGTAGLVIITEYCAL